MRSRVFLIAVLVLALWPIAASPIPYPREAMIFRSGRAQWDNSKSTARGTLTDRADDGTPDTLVMVFARGASVGNATGRYPSLNVDGTRGSSLTVTVRDRDSGEFWEFLMQFPASNSVPAFITLRAWHAAPDEPLRQVSPLWCLASVEREFFDETSLTFFRWMRALPSGAHTVPIDRSDFEQGSALTIDKIEAPLATTVTMISPGGGLFAYPSVFQIEEHDRVLTLAIGRMTDEGTAAIETLVTGMDRLTHAVGPALEHSPLKGPSPLHILATALTRWTAVNNERDLNWFVRGVDPKDVALH